jgi:hypothetical protein
VIEELRSIARPDLEQALGWVGYRVDDIYGAGVGKLEDVWVDPRSGEPRWLLVRSGRFGSHHTLIPFDDATAGAGHIWIPFERDAVRHAPDIDPREPLSRELDATLRAHYDAARTPAAPEVAPAPRPQVLRRTAASTPPPPIALSDVREQRRRAASERAAHRGEVDVSEAVIRLEGVGELDGQPVEIELTGTFTGTIRPRAQVRRTRRA